MRSAFHQILAFKVPSKNATVCLNIGKMVSGKRSKLVDISFGRVQTSSGGYKHTFCNEIQRSVFWSSK